jgi:hypothetical protein
MKKRDMGYISASASFITSKLPQRAMYVEYSFLIISSAAAAQRNKSQTLSCVFLPFQLGCEAKIRRSSSEEVLLTPILPIFLSA